VDSSHGVRLESDMLGVKRTVEPDVAPS
jgi:hypothetical protein